jgi:hypothetical protein
MLKDIRGRQFYGYHQIQISLCIFLSMFGGVLIAEKSVSGNPPQFEKEKFPHRPSRAESFLGIHFDFHATKDDTRIGENVTRQMVENIIDKVHPDYIQCDSKGHAGYSSYPTKVGTGAGGFVRDPLKIWRQVTAQRGVALYVHHSGVFDEAAIERNPSWACIDAKGQLDKHFTSVFGPYVNELLIPQLKELRHDYDIDGVWVDGECWAIRPDYSQWAMNAYREKNGDKEPPRNPDDSDYYEFMEFCRQGFRDYLAHYVTELHKFDPGFQIASNWAYSSFMPEPVNVNIDWLSGDFTPDDSVNAARYEGRCLRSQGKPWDLMAWGFYHKDDSLFNTKTAVQLQQELAVVLALGGGVQVYFTQNRDASINPWQMDVMSKVAEFCRTRQAICHKAQPVPQIALLYSREALYRKMKAVFRFPWEYPMVPFKGVLNALLDSQYSVEVLMEHHLTGNMEKYPLIIIPEWDYVGGDFKSELLAYVNQGGNLLLIGPQAAILFQEQLGITFEGNAEKKQQWLEQNGRLASINSPYQLTKLSDTAKPFGKIFASNGLEGESVHAASINQYGKGKIAGVYFDFGKQYRESRTVIAREFLNSLVRQLFPEPVAEVSGSHTVDVTVNQINGKLAVNLVNTSGPHSDSTTHVFDEIPHVGPLEITIRCPNKPKKVMLESDGKKMKYTYRDGKIHTVLPQLDIHSVIVVE